VNEKIEAEIKDRSTLVLPLATLIETGNHIAQASHSRREWGKNLGELMRLSADERIPWQHSPTNTPSGQRKSLRC